jgi:hypothetical protein
MSQYGNSNSEAKGMKFALWFCGIAIALATASVCLVIYWVFA